MALLFISYGFGDFAHEASLYVVILSYFMNLTSIAKGPDILVPLPGPEMQSPTFCAHGHPIGLRRC